MKSSLRLLVILLPVFFAGCACPPAPSAVSPQPPAILSSGHGEELAKQFCPIIYLCGEGEVTENFEPEQIEIMLDTAILHDVEDPSFSEKATLSSLLQWSKDIYYLDLVGLEPKTNSIAEYKITYEKAKARYQPTVYARVKEGRDKGYTVVQYWIFYYFNDWRNCHEGDWELVQLCFPGYTAQELLERVEQPVFAAYSQHQAGQKMLWNDMKANSLVIETHPVVYVAQGSHANYFVPGHFWSGLDFDNTGLSSWKVIKPGQLNLVLLPEIGTEDEKFGWLDFRGKWGEHLDGSISVLDLTFWQHGPSGPPWSEGGQKNRKWEYPDEWAAELPEYPDPFWTCFLELAGDWFNRSFFCLFSPANIHVYDSLGRHIGVNENGDVENQIPGGVYIAPQGTQYKMIVIPNTDISRGYELIVNGTGSGTMDIKIQVPDAKNKIRRYLEYVNVPVSATTTARVGIEPDRILKLELDSDDDGVFELESMPGEFDGKVVEAKPAGLSLKPRMADNEIGTQHRVVATVYDSDGKPLAGIKVDFAVGGANNLTGEATTDGNGQAIFSYYGKSPGKDKITAEVDSLIATTMKIWGSKPTIPTLARLVIYPVQAENLVGTGHTVTFVVYDTGGKPMPGIRVYFEVSGTVTKSGQTITGADGKASFAYTSRESGRDTIVAICDNLRATAIKDWVVQSRPPGR